METFIDLARSGAKFRINGLTRDNVVSRGDFEEQSTNPKPVLSNGSMDKLWAIQLVDEEKGVFTMECGGYPVEDISGALWASPDAKCRWQIRSPVGHHLEATQKTGALWVISKEDSLLQWLIPPPESGAKQIKIGSSIDNPGDGQLFEIEHVPDSE